LIKDKTKNFIAVKLTNGFGNNIFQYGAGRLLADYHKCYFFAIPPSKEYYAIDSLVALGVNFDSNCCETIFASPHIATVTFFVKPILSEFIST